MNVVFIVIKNHFLIIFFRSATVGYGIPPQDKVSLMVIIIISVGLGIPVVIIIFGGIYVCAKRRKELKVKHMHTFSGSSYDAIN